MKAVIALGSNIENRKLNLDIAITHLEKLISNLVTSKYIETKAVGGPIQADYLNAVAFGESELEAEELLKRLLEIENTMGRVRIEKWGPRLIDLDLIVFGDQIIDSDILKLPHPLAHTREFVIGPWLSIDPNGFIPGIGEIKTVLASLTQKS
ncbi:MAG TPA: 2-amino-4-hydroxy-6-hydroxymethyldihydropteridine diphosphokinase [Actinobacteria bacterium]|jgi:2-amino-4-hydroxy-6-hydroxymethyldihydropteridine diphosphokinase|uniref:2-amino-4-hydroxy-6- hydroxymethyldihydropteridine diphosphokinase n=1 Tax=Candidatus Nanopelagicus sp. TaxID=2518620 RepID=UPI00014DDFC0|nr:MAG: 2-amino-4-hydroxy-6-hydroxymethyldihydropteridine pyrophosphokinase [Actinobacteria bacterium BACL4 MAG-121001-bin59]KRO77545.1 MAG: 2-amino-4-hydroxy-6-hydroxymethyldihydropteridine pyrophosphokinase [Actinobacteria bacterium BACL4 MAG-120920-bin74]HCP72555.1 2-amino-4-hydroxy-6-hydroxymethyldihydropteridine diphosphokinase [Actinomycetota bacterium]